MSRTDWAILALVAVLFVAADVAARAALRHQTHGPCYVDAVEARGSVHQFVGTMRAGRCLIYLNGGKQT